MNNPGFEDDENMSDGNASFKRQTRPVQRSRSGAIMPQAQANKMISFAEKKEDNDDGDDDDEKEWIDYSQHEKVMFVSLSVLKFVLFVVLLYLFLLSLSFMSIGFTMVSSYALLAGDTIGFLLSNPFASLAIGIVATALMQNATATTSIAVIMVGAGIIPSVKSSVPIIMGANIGTCVTNSFIALTLADDPAEFKRAFSAATLNDGFNLLTTLIMLPIEIFTGFLFRMSELITDAMPFENAEQIAKANFMASILNPVTDLFILMNATAVDLLSAGNRDVKDVALRCCHAIYVSSSTNSTNLTMNTANETNSTTHMSMICLSECTHWCMPMLRALGDGGTGLFWIVLSIVVLICSLFGIVKVLSLLIVGPIAKRVRRWLNASYREPFKWVNQLILFLIAFLLTIVVQSSNIITATLVPLCGIGIISLQKVYVMTLGSNIGTTVTGILTAFTQPPSSLKKAMQLAFVYTMFNSIGVIFWLPLPFLRFPKRIARTLGNLVFEYRWFLYLYVSCVYFVLPLIVFGLALVPHWIGLGLVGIPIILAVLFFATLTLMQRKCGTILPTRLRDFKWLPVWMRSLRPLDAWMSQLSCCGKSVATTVASPIDPVSSTAGLSPKAEARRDAAALSVPRVVRRMSAINSLVKEARRYSVRAMNDTSAALSVIDSSSEDEYDTDVVKEYKQQRRKSSTATASGRSIAIELAKKETTCVETRF